MSDNLFIDFETEEGRQWPITIVLCDRKTKEIIDRIDTTASTLNGAITVMSIMYNRLSYSGGIEWWNPSTGERYFNGLSYHLELIHPETRELVTANIEKGRR